MESEKVKEIKELLRCMNGEKGCTNCYINDVAQEQETCCINIVADMTLELINELESENERLTTENVNYYGAREQTIEDLAEIINKQKKQISELKKENLKLKKKQIIKVAKFAKSLYTKYKVTGESSQVYIFCTEEELNEEVQRCNYDG